MSIFYDECKGVCYRTLDFMGFPNYKIGDDGSVYFTTKRGLWSILKLKGNKWGHLLARLHYKGKHVAVFAHRIVLMAFVGPCPEGMETSHFPDRDPANNRLENLR